MIGDLSGIVSGVRRCPAGIFLYGSLCSRSPSVDRSSRALRMADPRDAISACVGNTGNPTVGTVALEEPIS